MWGIQPSPARVHLKHHFSVLPNQQAVQIGKLALRIRLAQCTDGLSLPGISNRPTGNPSFKSAGLEVM